MNQFVLGEIIHDTCEALNIADADAILQGMPLVLQNLGFHFRLLPLLYRTSRIAVTITWGQAKEELDVFPVRKIMALNEPLIKARISTFYDHGAGNVKSTFCRGLTTLSSQELALIIRTLKRFSGDDLLAMATYPLPYQHQERLEMAARLARNKEGRFGVD